MFYFISKLIVLFYGMLYPAYCSYKAVKTKDVREYVNWMMYWVVFAFFCFFETFADTLLGLWFPFYYELKIMFILWIVSPKTRGGNILYRRLIHPNFVLYEPDIDAYLADIKFRTSCFLLQWGTKFLGNVTDIIWKTANDSGILRQIRKMCSRNRTRLGGINESQEQELVGNTLNIYPHNHNNERKAEIYARELAKSQEHPDFNTDDEDEKDGLPNDQHLPKESAAASTMKSKSRATESSLNKSISKKKKSVPTMYATLPRSRRSQRLTIRETPI